MKDNSPESEIKNILQLDVCLYYKTTMENEVNKGQMDVFQKLLPL